MVTWGVNPQHSGAVANNFCGVGGYHGGLARICTEHQQSLAESQWCKSVFSMGEGDNRRISQHFRRFQLVSAHLWARFVLISRSERDMSGIGAHYERDRSTIWAWWVRYERAHVHIALMSAVWAKYERNMSTFRRDMSPIWALAAYFQVALALSTNWSWTSIGSKNANLRHY